MVKRARNSGTQTGETSNDVRAKPGISAGGSNSAFPQSEIGNFEI
jgi:hypothetical protein